MWWSCKLRRALHVGIPHRQPSRANTGSRWRGRVPFGPDILEERSKPRQRGSPTSVNAAIAVSMSAATDAGAGR